MPIAYVDTADFDAVCDGKVRQFLFTDDGDSGSEYSTRFTRAAQIASSLALASAKQAGYAPAEETDDDSVKALALSFLVHMAYGRKARDIPPSLAAILAPIPEGVRSGELPLASTSVSNLSEATGGSKLTPTEETVTTGTTSRRIFRRPVMRDLANLV